MLSITSCALPTNRNDKHGRPFVPFPWIAFWSNPMYTIRTMSCWGRQVRLPSSRGHWNFQSPPWRTRHGPTDSDLFNRGRTPLPRERHLLPNRFSPSVVCEDVTSQITTQSSPPPKQRMVQYRCYFITRLPFHSMFTIRFFPDACPCSPFIAFTDGTLESLDVDVGRYGTNRSAHQEIHPTLPHWQTRCTLWPGGGFRSSFWSRKREDKGWQ